MVMLSLFRYQAVMQAGEYCPPSISVMGLGAGPTLGKHCPLAPCHHLWCHPPLGVGSD